LSGVFRIDSRLNISGGIPDVFLERPYNIARNATTLPCEGMVRGTLLLLHCRPNPRSQQRVTYSAVVFLGWLEQQRVVALPGGDDIAVCGDAWLLRGDALSPHWSWCLGQPEYHMSDWIILDDLDVRSEVDNMCRGRQSAYCGDAAHHWAFPDRAPSSGEVHSRRSRRALVGHRP